MTTTSLGTTIALDPAGIISRSSPVPYYFQLSSFVEKKIQDKEWIAGSTLPSEQEFCEKLGISRTVVRQAISDLERKGLVLKQNGKRTTISFPKYDGGLMQSMRGFYEDAVAKGKKPETKVLEMKSVPASGEIANALQLKEGEPVILLNRLRFLDGEPEVLVVTYLPEKLCPRLVEADLSNQSLYEWLAREYGHRIAKGSRTIEAVAADRQDAKLLGLRLGSPVLLLKSIGRLADGTPLEFFIARHRGDRSQFHVQLVSDRS